MPILLQKSATPQQKEKEKKLPPRQVCFMTAKCAEQVDGRLDPGAGAGAGAGPGAGPGAGARALTVD